MKIINMYSEDLKSLKKLEIRNTTNKDGELFYLPSEDGTLLFKKFYDYDQDEFLNKICTVINLHSQKQDVPVKGLVYPEALVTVDGMLNGYARKYIDGISLKELLGDNEIPFLMKKECLIQIGKILENMQYTRSHSNHHDFYLNDIHEGNFIVEYANGDVNAIDLDSACIRGNYTSPSMYLRPASRLTLYNDKYFLENYNPIYGKQIVPTQNTEIYCYSIMILNFLYGDYTAYMPNFMLQEYLDYLSKLGYNSSLLNALSKLYSNEDNINPVRLLEDLHEDVRTNTKYYHRVLKKTLK